MLISPQSATANRPDTPLPSYEDLGFNSQMQKKMADNPYQNSDYQSLLQFQTRFEGVDSNMLSSGATNSIINFGGTVLNGNTGGMSLGAGSTATVGGISGSQAIQVDGSKGTIKLINSNTGGYILFDGPNGRIVVNDGTNNRIVIGRIS